MWIGPLSPIRLWLSRRDSIRESENIHRSIIADGDLCVRIIVRGRLVVSRKHSRRSERKKIGRRKSWESERSAAGHKRTSRIAQTLTAATWEALNATNETSRSRKSARLSSK